MTNVLTLTWKNLVRVLLVLVLVRKTWMILLVILTRFRKLLVHKASGINGRYTIKQTGELILIESEVRLR